MGLSDSLIAIDMAANAKSQFIILKKHLSRPLSIPAVRQMGGSEFGVV